MGTISPLLAFRIMYVTQAFVCFCLGFKLFYDKAKKSERFMGFPQDERILYGVTFLFPVVAGVCADTANNKMMAKSSTWMVSIAALLFWAMVFQECVFPENAKFDAGRPLIPFTVGAGWLQLLSAIFVGFHDIHANLADTMDRHHEDLATYSFRGGGKKMQNANTAGYYGTLNQGMATCIRAKFLGVNYLVVHLINWIRENGNRV
ncbi:unnamed protein product [Amoebophrya sp. A120]|nr:unnamed protein product [Amoebophrya sp. A120]|eukprot:GSA120T00007663001.1